MTAVLDAVPTSSRSGPPPVKRGVRADIQGLRAVAVLVVILDHLTGWPSGGFVGVDIFFVISGFLITGLLLREYDATDRISFGGFYRRRVRRIIPVATLVLVTTALVARALLPKDRASSVQADAAWALVFGANWHMSAVGTDYFQKGLPPSPLQHYWSLSLEEQFYFIWPWVMLALVVLAAKIGWGKRARRGVIIGFFSTAIVASFGWAMHQTATAPDSAYFNTFARAWELGIGALLAALGPALGKIRNAWRVPMTVLGLGGIVASVFVVTENHAFPAPWAALPVLATGMVIAAGTNVQEAAAHGMALREVLLLPLTNRVAVYVGDISYSLYLWHFPVVVLLLAFFPAGTVVYWTTAIVGMTALSVLSYHLVEVPVRNSRWLEHREPAEPVPVKLRFVLIKGEYVPIRVEAPKPERPSRRSRGLMTALLVCALTALSGGVAAYSALHDPSASSASPVVLAAKGDCRGADFMPAAHKACSNPVPTSLTPSTDDFAEDTGPEYSRCWREEDDVQKICHFGSTEPDALRVAVVGDSHGGHLAPAIDSPAMLTKKNWSVDLLTGYGCQWKTEHQYGGCQRAMDDDMARFEAQPYDVIITSSARWALKDENPEYAADEYQAAWKKVTRLGTKVIVIADNPLMSDQAIACFTRVGYSTTGTRCGEPKSAALSQVDPLLIAASRPNQPKVHLVDMTDFFCTEDFCPSVVGGTVVYRDTVGHVTATYMKTLRPYLMERIEAALR